MGERDVYEGPERRATDELGRWRREVHGRLERHAEDIAILKHGHESLRSTMGSLARSMDRVTEIVERIDKNTAPVVEDHRDGVGAKRKFEEWTGWILKAAALIVAVGIIYWFITTGTLPRKS